MLDHFDENWPAVRQNVGKAHQVCIWLVKIIRREASDLRVSEMFYRSVVQEVLLFGVENWVLLAEMYRKLAGVHVGFLIEEKGQKSKR